MLKKITKDELKQILDNHKLWLEDNSKGKRADLSFADLHSADLHSADLSGIDLRSADLRFANLSSANLSYADLRSANLSSADLSSANLSSAKLGDAYLCFANLDKQYIQISCIGSRKGTTTYCVDDDIIYCGCWTGTLKEFEKRVKETHKNNEQYLKEYLGAIRYFKSISMKGGKR